MDMITYYRKKQSVEVSRKKECDDGRNKSRKSFSKKML